MHLETVQHCRATANQQDGQLHFLPKLAFDSKPMVCAYMTNFSFIGIYCHPREAKMANLTKFFSLGAPVPNPLTDQGHIWHVRINT